ncbi:class I SAM-dependent methyltransferase [Desulfovibrio ferrophilus]|uniref:Glycosyltransferase-like protein n=1 Tax=Desulfovibrio ferrophilus TaxID=241368 RepID=A0A2Z6B1A2_9BACT|nr:class I SAM-dependent methyltransferase [Desulfovibrio ferrophilus]BBD09299.1 glycosyltransferase-like protein [Desulfovibrio ferrophilus]
MSHPNSLCKDVVRANVHGLSAKWYPPLLAGAETLSQILFDTATHRGVGAILDKLTPDEYAVFISQFIAKGIETHGSQWRYADICTALFALSNSLKVDNYLEIGVRRGRSMSMVAGCCPQASIVGFDLWMDNYAGLENPGPEFVRQEMSNLGFQGSLDFVSGNSHDTVPAYFEQNPDATFDLITVDGDHSPEGAMADLLTVIPRLRIGGAIVFDDIVHPQHTYLMDIWNRAVASRPFFSSFKFTDLGYGVAFAIRRS